MSAVVLGADLLYAVVSLFTCDLVMNFIYCRCKSGNQNTKIALMQSGCYNAKANIIGVAI